METIVNNNSCWTNHLQNCRIWKSPTKGLKSQSMVALKSLISVFRTPCASLALVGVPWCWLNYSRTCLLKQQWFLRLENWITISYDFDSLMIAIHCFQFQNRALSSSTGSTGWHVLMMEAVYDVKLEEFFMSFYELFVM